MKIISANVHMSMPWDIMADDNDSDMDIAALIKKDIYRLFEIDGRNPENGVGIRQIDISDIPVSELPNDILASDHYGGLMRLYFKRKGIETASEAVLPGIPKAIAHIESDKIIMDAPVFADLIKQIEMYRRQLQYYMDIHQRGSCMTESQVSS